jgi:hypothetical protein
MMVVLESPVTFWLSFTPDLVSESVLIDPSSFQTANLNLVFKDSSPVIPLIFVLSTGTDPAADLYKFAEEMRFSKKLSAISLGQGQVGEYFLILMSITNIEPIRTF